MGTGWLNDSVQTIAAVCAVITAIECVMDNNASESGLRFVCGAVAASTILRLLSTCVQNLPFL